MLSPHQDTQLGRLITEPPYREYLGETWNMIGKAMPQHARQIFYCIMALGRLNFSRGYSAGHADALRGRHFLAPVTPTTDGEEEPN